MRHAKILSVFLTVIMLLSMLSVCCYATENEGEVVENYGLVEDPYERLETAVTNDTTELSTSYDPRDFGYATVTKNQSPYNLCWMYATIGAAEQYISKNYGSQFDISEAHGAVTYSNSIIPQEFEGEKDYYSNYPNAGNSTANALQYLSNWNEPILEHNNLHWNSMVLEDSYPKDKLVASYGVPITDDFENAKPVFNLTEAIYIEDSDTSIKYAISRYGGVITDLHMQQQLLNRDSNNEFNIYLDVDETIDKTIKNNHSVVIVGWDDNYSRENFKESCRPNNDGAWLIRNTWYNKDTTNYIWVSYEHKSLHNYKTRRIAITGMQEANDNEYMLSYDYKLIGSNTTPYNETVYLCNAFDIADYTDIYDKITKVMMYLKTTGCNYRIKIIQLDEDNNMPTNLDNVGVLAAGSYKGEGYLTVDLESDYEFVNDNKCAVIVELIPDSENSQIYIPYVMKSSVVTEPTESFYGFDDDNNGVSWTDCYSDTTKFGNFGIRPVMEKEIPNSHYASITPTQIVDDGNDVNIDYDTDSVFLYARTKNYIFLRDRTDYIKEGKRITLKKEFISSLGGKYTELLFAFTNGLTEKVVINPKADITDVSIQGKPLVGETLDAICTGIPEKDNYDLNYQWQVSANGTAWFDITNANSKTYTVTDNEKNLFIRVKVTSSSKYGNVVHPLEKCSPSTECEITILGDVDLDGIVSVIDATLVSQYIVGSKNLSIRQLLAANANKDGYIDITDSTRIQYITVGVTFP